MNSADIFLIAMTIIFAVPYLIWRLARTDYYAPLVVVQILTGILLGPGILGAALPHVYASVFSPPVIAALNGIAWWAVMLFVWIAGIELDLKPVWIQRRECGITAGLALGTPLLFGCIAALGLLAWRSGWIGPAAAPWQFVLGVGMACAVTALPFLLLFAPVAYLFRRLMRWLPEADRWYVGLIWLAACGLAADRSGLHFMVGAFLSGAVIEREWFNQQHMDLLRHHVLLVLMPVFFLSTGLRTNWTVGSGAVFIAAAVLLLAAVGGKLAGVKLAGHLLGWAQGDAWIIGWLLQTKALIMIIFVNILLDRDLITGATFTALLLMAVVSTMLTVPLAAPRLRRLAASVNG